MVPIKYITKIQDGCIVLPPKIADMIEKDFDFEVVIRPLHSRYAQEQDINEVIGKIEKGMSVRFPNIKKKMNEKLRAIAGLSKNMNDVFSKYSDEELLSIARMEKYMEKGEILESLY